MINCASAGPAWSYPASVWDHRTRRYVRICQRNDAAVDIDVVLLRNLCNHRHGASSAASLLQEKDLEGHKPLTYFIVTGASSWLWSLQVTLGDTECQTL